MKTEAAVPAAHTNERPPLLELEATKKTAFVRAREGILHLKNTRRVRYHEPVQFIIGGSIITEPGLRNYGCFGCHKHLAKFFV